MRKYATLLAAVLLSLLSALSYAQAPVPFINLPLMPDATAPGGAAIHSHRKWHRLCFELGGELEWQCAGDSVRQRFTVDGDCSGSGHCHGEHGLGDGGQSGAGRRHVEYGVPHGHRQRG